MRRPLEVKNTKSAKSDRGRKASVTIARKISGVKAPPLTHEEVVAKYCTPLTDEEWSARLNFQGKLGVYDPTLSIYYNDLNRFAEKQRVFLLAYGTHGLMREACHAARVSRQAVAEWMKNDENFREAFESADADATDDLEQFAIARAKDSSDQLMMFLLKAKKPEKFVEKAAQESARNRNRATATKQTWKIGDFELEF